jgi:hypothetical protein
MDETGTNDKLNQKRPYAKPEIQEVPLRPDEAVLGGCKTSSGSGPAQARCTHPASCSAATS